MSTARDIVCGILPDPVVRQQVLAFVGKNEKDRHQIWYGPGTNGKTTLAHLLQRAFPDFDYSEDGRSSYSKCKVLITNVPPVSRPRRKVDVINFDRRFKKANYTNFFDSLDVQDLRDMVAEAVEAAI